jgi:serine/threonine protein kinase
VNTGIEKLPFRDLSFYGDPIVKLGEGSYGSVYRVQAKDKKMYAVKAFGHGLDTDALREISILRYVKHPNIIKLIDVLAYNDANGEFKLRMVLELGEMSLKSFIRNGTMYKDRKANEPLMLSYMYQLTRGLQYLHENDIIHRDLKPDNVIVFADGRITISDLGVSRFGYIKGTIYSHPIETLPWRAPEILLGAKIYGPEVDVYALGLMFAEIVIGKTGIMYTGGPERDVLLKQISVLGHFTDAYWPGVSGMKGYDSQIAEFAKMREQGKWPREFKEVTEFPMLLELIKLVQEMTYPNPSKRQSLPVVLDSVLFAQRGTKNLVETQIPYVSDVAPVCGLPLKSSIIRVPSYTFPEYSKPCKHYYNTLFSWLSEVMYEYRLSFETYFHARQLFDLVLFKLDPNSPYKTITKTLQFLGVSCLLLANRMLEVFSIEEEQAVYISDNLFTVEQVKEMENIIAKIVGFDLAFPNIAQYIKYYTRNFERVDFLAVTHMALMYCWTCQTVDADHVAAICTSIVAHCKGYQDSECLDTSYYLRGIETGSSLVDQTILDLRALRLTTDPAIAQSVNYELNLKKPYAVVIDHILNTWPDCKIDMADAKEIEETEDERGISMALPESSDRSLEYETTTDAEDLGPKQNYILSIGLQIAKDVIDNVSREMVGDFVKDLILAHLTRDYSKTHEIGILARYFGYSRNMHGQYMPPTHSPHKLQVIIGAIHEMTAISVAFNSFPSTDLDELKEFAQSLQNTSYHNEFMQAAVTDTALLGV